jgi:hypothetical protein
MVDRIVAEQKVRWPAIGLIVTAVAGALFQLLGLAWDVFSDTPAPWQTDEQIPTWAIHLMNSFGVALTLIALAAAGFLVFGAIKLMRLESYGIALAACIVALVPCISPCCCIGLPIGIWALIVMHAPDVRPAFQGAAQPGGPVT